MPPKANQGKKGKKSGSQPSPIPATTEAPEALPQPAAAVALPQAASANGDNRTLTLGGVFQMSVPKDLATAAETTVENLFEVAVKSLPQLAAVPQPAGKVLLAPVSNSTESPAEVKRKERCKALRKRWEGYVEKHNLKSEPAYQIKPESAVFQPHPETKPASELPILVLSCDGGGVRGAATAAAVAAIESIFKDEAMVMGIEPPPFAQLCNWEVFAGTSTGSFVTGMLAACNVSGKDVVEMYQNQAAVMMPPKSWTQSILSKVTNTLNQAKYTNEGKELVMQMALQDKDTGKQKTMGSISQGRQLLVCSYRIKNRPGLRVFDSDSKEDKDIYVWQVCDASSAAPVYYTAVVVNGEEFVDGGVALNNPSLLALNAAKARSMVGNRPVFVLSMGTGSKPADMGSDVGAAEALCDGLTNFVTDCWSQHFVATQYCQLHDWNYLRVDGDLAPFNASEDMDNITPANIANLVTAGHAWAKSKEVELRRMFRSIVASQADVVIRLPK